VYVIFHPIPSVTFRDERICNTHSALRETIKIDFNLVARDINPMSIPDSRFPRPSKAVLLLSKSLKAQDLSGSMRTLADNRIARPPA